MFLKETPEITSKAVKMILERSEGAHEEATVIKETGKRGWGWHRPWEFS